MGCCSSKSRQVRKTKTRVVAVSMPVTREDGTVYSSQKIVELNELERQLGQSNKQALLVRNFLRNDVLELQIAPHEIANLTHLFKRHTNPESGLMQFDSFCTLLSLPDTEQAGNFAGSQNDLLRRQLFDGMVDENKDGITLIAFLKGVSYWKSALASTSDAFVFFFRMFDSDQSGAMDRTEFTKMVQHVLVSQIYSSSSEQPFNEQLAAAPTEEVRPTEELRHCGAPPATNIQDNTGTLGFGSPETERRRLVTDFASLVFSNFDDDNSGEISYDEFCSWVRANPKSVASLGGSDEALLETFKRFDNDGNLALDKQEFIHMLRATHVLNETLPQDVEARIEGFVSSVFTAIDTDGSGEIEIGEFQNWMVRHPKDGELLLKEGGELKLRRTSNSTQAHLHNAFLAAPAASRRAFGDGGLEGQLQLLQRTASAQAMIDRSKVKRGSVGNLNIDGVDVDGGEGSVN